MATKLKEIEAFILTGGQSRRFGKPKCLIKHNGKILTQIVYDNIIKSLKSVSVVGKNNHFEHHNFIIDSHEIQCPMNGIATALENSQSDWIFVIACDMPLINSKIIDYLYKNIDFSKKALIPKINEKLQPLCGFYNKSILIDFNNSIIDEEFSLFKLLKQLDIAKIAMPLKMEKQFLNINYPKDTEKLI